MEWRRWEPACWNLLSGVVHVWRLATDPTPAEVEKQLHLLDAAERRRAAGFLRIEDFARFVIGRSLVRRILALHFRSSPSDLVFESDRFGRPRIVSPAAAGADFNISHSGRWILVALSSGRRVGVDIEGIRSNLDTGAIMNELFTPAERVSVAALSGEGRERAFFWYWTRKEALAKAIGIGLSAPLAEMDVSAETVDGWEVRSLPLESQYRAAVAASGYGWPLACWDAQDT